MALIKGNRSSQSTAEEGPSAAPDSSPSRKGVIFRSRSDLNQILPEAPPEVVPPLEGFQEGLTRTTVSMRVLNRRSTAQPSSLPPIAIAVRIPTGFNDPQGSETEEIDAPAPVLQQVIIQQAPAVDQAIIEEAQRRAEEMVQEAQATADQMLMKYQLEAQAMMEKANQQIQVNAEQIQRQAQELGFQQGYEQGLQQGGLTAQQQVYQELRESREILIQAIKQRHLLLQNVEPTLARLSVKVAEKLLGQELAQFPEAILSVVRLALADISDREQVFIRVNPVDHEKVSEQRSNFEKMIEGLKKFDILADAAIDPGGCVIETNLGNIDARLHTRLSALTNGLEEVAVQQDKEILQEVSDLQPQLPDLPPSPQEDQELSVEAQEEA